MTASDSLHENEFDHIRDVDLGWFRIGVLLIVLAVFVIADAILQVARGLGLTKPL